ncbi:MAG: CPBP family intramembrane metalloprotease [Lachnospiraceae bacterium]|nr:CPBP family intramembrane metalloprotease [Lachnospiraceae bacterium]
MDFWKMYAFRWDRDIIQKWPSLKKTGYLLLPLLFYFVIHDVAEIILWACLDFVMQHATEEIKLLFTANTDTVRGIINGSSILIGTALIWPAIRNEIRGNDTRVACETTEVVTTKKISIYGFVLAFAFCMALGLNILFYQLGITGKSQSYEVVKELQYGVQFVFGLILYGVISPFAEEAVFRGLLYNRMKRCFSVGIAVVLSALLFGLYHGNMVQALYGTILGIVIAYLYEMTGRFEVPFLFHAMANVSVYVMTYHNTLSGMNSAMAWTMAVVLLFMAAGFFAYLRKICKKAQG